MHKQYIEKKKENKINIKQNEMKSTTEAYSCENRCDIMVNATLALP